MFTDFFFCLRAFGVAVSLDEWLTLQQGLDLGLHGSSLGGFYELARMTLVKSESDFDAFDQAFAFYFRGVEPVGELPEALRAWLESPITPEEWDRAAADARYAGLSLEELRAMLEDRLRRQTERHDGGSYWIGTGGTSPFGNSGYNPNGLRLGGESRSRSALQVAGSREYRDFRRDAALDVRQFQMAFRRLRQLTAREDGPKDELALDETIRATCDNAGHLKLVFTRPRDNQVKLLLLFDSGGSMSPYISLCARLFQAAHQSNHFKDLRTYYFHNCVYERLYTTPACFGRDSESTAQLIANLSPDWKVIFIGDGAMAPSELLDRGGGGGFFDRHEESGLAWLRRFTGKYSHLIWLNPLPQGSWERGFGSFTIERIRRELAMYPLTLEGLDAGLRKLMASR
jgi:uncharacterized protein with von Willebrand factor type A (vWA) domain